MFKSNVIVMLISFLIITSLKAELIPYNDLIVYDTDADLYWYRPLFNISELLEYEMGYDTYLKGIELMNKDPELQSDKWGPWHVAGEKEINKLLNNDLMEFIYFGPSDAGGLVYYYERMYDKPNPPSDNDVGRISVIIPDTAFLNANPDAPYYEPEISLNDFTSKDNSTGGEGGAMGIWAVAQGTSNEVPEPSAMLLMLAGFLGIIMLKNKQKLFSLR